jgi:predicted heme/steroid binding protein
MNKLRYRRKKFMNKKMISLLVAALLVLSLTLASCGGASNVPAASSAPTEKTTASAGALQAFTKDTLAQYNGQNGNPAYVAVNGKVYDVSNIRPWKNGQHQGLSAGVDLSKAIEMAPHGLGILDTLTVVGTYQ